MKKKIKKRWLYYVACLTALMLLASCSAANATNTTPEANENYEGVITVSDSGSTCQGQGATVEGSTVTITAGGTFLVKGTLSDGMLKVNTKEKVQLVLDGVTITNKNGPAVFVEDAKQITVTLKLGSENTLADGSTYKVDAKGTLFSNDTLIINGEGALVVTGSYKHGIASDDDVIIEGGNITISAKTDGIHANDDVTVKGGSLNITAESDGVDSEGTLVVDGGTVKISAGDDGLHADKELTVNGGDITVTKSYEGIESKTVLTVNGGNISVRASDDGFNAGTDMVINGGYTYIECDGDGLDSNGSMTVNGGTTVLHGGLQGEGPLDIGDGGNYTFTINGGTVIACGGNMTINVSAKSKQNSVWINGQISAKTAVNIADGSNHIVTFEATKGASAIFVSTPDLKSNTTYTVSTGGTAGGDKKDSVYQNGTYAGGTQLGSFTTSSVTSSVGTSAGGMGGGPRDN